MVRGRSESKVINRGEPSLQVRLGMKLLVTLLILVTGGFWVHEWRRSDWRGVEPYRMVVWSEEEGRGVKEVALVSYVPEEKKVVSYRIPSDVYTPVGDGYGTYQVGSLKRLGEIQGEDSQLLVETMAHTFGYHVNSALFTEDDLSRGEIISLARDAIWQYKDRNTNAYDMLRMWWILRSVPESHFEWYDLNGRHVYYNYVDVDGQEKREIYIPLLDAYMEKTAPFALEKYFGTQIVVVNSVGKTGLAGEVARLLTHEGFDVVRVDDLDEKYEKTQVWYEGEEFEASDSAARLKVILGRSEVGEKEVLENYRAPVVVVVGEDMVRN